MGLWGNFILAPQQIGDKLGTNSLIYYVFLSRYVRLIYNFSCAQKKVDTLVGTCWGGFGDISKWFEGNVAFSEGIILNFSSRPGVGKEKYLLEEHRASPASMLQRVEAARET